MSQFPDNPKDRPSVIRILFKAVLFFAILNILFALLNPLPFIGQLTIYNWLVPGRARLPYGEDERAYNMSLDSLEAMFASHEIAQPKAADEFRLLLIGDSATWGILLRPDDTLAGQLNRNPTELNDGRIVRAYNLGHPILSLTKDLLILDEAMRYQPDMIVWLTTLRSFPNDKQFFAPLVQHNADRIRPLLEANYTDEYFSDAQLSDTWFMDRTLIGQRRPLADWLRLQLYGIMWSVTGIDQVYAEEVTLRTRNFEADLSWDDITEPRELLETDLAFNVLTAGHEIAASIPMLLVNEPIYISDGQNSDLRYNLWYPRWAYDNYRALYSAVAQDQGWHYLDLWNLIESDEFTDSPVHLTPQGSRQLAERLQSTILRLATEGSITDG